MKPALVILLILLSSCSPQINPHREQKKIERKSVRPDTARKATVYIFILACPVFLVLEGSQAFDWVGNLRK